MSEEEQLDVIVVGAGLAGLACAHEAAGAGLSVAVLERGDVAGAKNVSGGRLFLEPLRELCAELLEGAPFERPVVSESVVLCDDRSSLSARIESESAEDTPHSVTVLRAPLDAHLADRVARKGAMVLPQRADALVRENGRVVGVQVGPETLRARVTVAADGVLSFLAEEAGLRPARKPGWYAVGVKEVIQLDPARIEERFNLAPGQGAARLYLGRVTQGLPGGGFLYTNRGSLSLGLVVFLEGLARWKSEALFPDLLEAFKQRPDMEPLLTGGKTVEYGAHLVPEGGLRALPEAGVPGLLLAGDAAGLVLNTGAVLRGMDLALASGTLAGRAITAALGSGGEGEVHTLYARSLQESFVMRQLRAHRKSPRVLALDRLYKQYPQRLVGWARELMRGVNAAGEHPRAKSAFRRLRRDVLGFRGLRDLWRLMRM